MRLDRVSDGSRPRTTEQIINHPRADGVAEGGWVHASELFPREMSVADLCGDFFAEVDGRDVMMFCDALVRLHAEGDLAFVVGLNHPFVHEEGDDDVHRGVGLACVLEDAFEAANGVLAGVMSVLIIVDRELYEEEVNGAFGKNVAFETERAGGGAGGRNAGGDEFELGFWKPLFQRFTHHGAVTIHLGDGSSDEGDAAFSGALKNVARVRVSASELHIFAKGDFSFLCVNRWGEWVVRKKG